MKRSAVAVATAVATVRLAAWGGGGGGAVNPAAPAGLGAPGVRVRQLSFDGSTRNYRVSRPMPAHHRSGLG